MTSRINGLDDRLTRHEFEILAACIDHWRAFGHVQFRIGFVYCPDGVNVEEILRSLERKGWVAVFPDHRRVGWQTPDFEFTQRAVDALGIDATMLGLATAFRRTARRGGSR